MQRFEVERGIASYERVEPERPPSPSRDLPALRADGALRGPGLERAIEQVSEQVRFEIAEHDVVLRGLCERCAN